MKRAMIVLSEIYGVNDFIKAACQKGTEAGFDVFCPDVIGRPPFPYEAARAAYDHFHRHIGFDVYREISASIGALKERYEKVVVVGFSVGATIAWRLCENPHCDGIVAFYGSRIRDYLNLNPVCPTLLLLAKEDGVRADALGDKAHLMIIEFDAGHGFMDSFSAHFDPAAALRGGRSPISVIKLPLEPAGSRGLISLPAGPLFGKEAGPIS